ncbi:hypothetical protein [Solibacillus daqui]|uniref:hypothetical protein n=1 Tax=Solibacillus daqui TaxID=2912187 RepID=UPI002365BA4B|nr:hypothetical protein [Solibacillus daqui]
MKKFFGLFILLFTLMLASCVGEASITSTLIVIEKGHSSDYKEYWIKAYDPNNQNKEEAFKIVIQEEMVWNLIKKDEEYFSLYSKKGDNPWILEHIEYSVAGKG